MNPNRRHIWSTDHEISYIRTMGSHSAQKISRHELLKNYFHAMQRRANWEGMNRSEIMKAIYKAMTQTIPRN